MPSLPKFSLRFLSRCFGIFRHWRIFSDRDAHNDYENPAIECYACTQAGVPAFHSTSCDRSHSPEWEADAGSSLIPIQGRRGSGQGAHRATNTTGPFSSWWIFGRVLDPRSKRVQRWNRALLLARGVSLAIDPLFFYSLSIGLGGAPCLYMDGGLAAIVTALRTLTDAVHLFHVWLQFRLAYVSRESLVVGCGKLVWDAQEIASHYVRSIKGFWFDAFVILPVPQLVDRSDFTYTTWWAPKIFFSRINDGSGSAGVPHTRYIAAVGMCRARTSTDARVVPSYTNGSKEIKVTWLLQ